MGSPTLCGTGGRRWLFSSGEDQVSAGTRARRGLWDECPVYANPAVEDSSDSTLSQLYCSIASTGAIPVAEKAPSTLQTSPQDNVSAALTIPVSHASFPCVALSQSTIA